MKTTAADIALVLFAVFIVLEFFWHSWLQRQRTGSTGLCSTNSYIGSLESMVGVSFVITLEMPVI
ncbi:hypothetical protein [Mycobacterium lepromatosis]|uniref:hypothetical protein n=1 Tax=Mycobacterium lepromatosis TaxID=480418 RepID=UPI0005F8657E|nr:hypothetical protein [Mycobacterium lepromatosis]